MLPLEPGAADAEDRSPARNLVERRGELGRQARIPERVRANHEAEADPRREGSQGRQRRPAFEDGLLPGAEDREHVIPGPDRIPASCLGVQGRVAEARPAGGL